MQKSNRAFWLLMWTLSCVVVAALASAATFFVVLGTGPNKLTELEKTIERYFIGQVDKVAMEDAAASAMVDALPDQWSYYIPLSEMQSYEDQKTNSYVGVGITIAVREDRRGFDILRVEPGGSAQKAGVMPGDVLIEADGQILEDVGTEVARQIILGEAGDQVSIAVLRDGQRMEFTLTLKKILVAVAEGQMLEGNVGYIRIANFNDYCASQTRACIEELVEEGATSLLFDVRDNPGGYKHELVELLDYLLPEGDLFTSYYYNGFETTDKSDANCVELPMAVLMNGDSYSAAEFFAAALREYDRAVTVGQPTVGKGYFQQTMELSDGSAVALSVGKYFTPKGVCLADVGGLVPDIPVEVDEETAALIYSRLVEPMEDPQILAALEALKD